MKTVTSMKVLKDAIRCFEDGEMTDVECLQIVINDALGLLAKIEKDPNGGKE
jgi:hypothetical protein